MTRILIADDHDLMRQGMRSLLASKPGLEVVDEAKDGSEAVQKANKCRPDVVVLDLAMPKMTGLEAARKITNDLPETRVLIFTIHDSHQMVRDTLAAGAHGYILKSDAAMHLTAGVEAVARHDLYFSSGVSDFVIDSLIKSRVEDNERSPKDIPLSPRELDVLRLLAQGKSNKEVATSLFISVRTVETHRRTIHQKLKITSLAELVRYAIRHHLVRA